MSSTKLKTHKTFDERFGRLNSRQQDAVKATEGPVAVIAGPGTGKTELVSVRIANILKKSDASAENILCLTYTDAGVLAMRERLIETIGADAYKINIFTFHAFGSMIMNQNMSLFFDDLPFRPATPIKTHQIMTSILDALPHGHTFRSRSAEHTKTKALLGAISDIKKAGLTNAELQQIIASNDIDIDRAEAIFQPFISQRISTALIDKYSEAALSLAALQGDTLPNNIPTYLDTVRKSLLRALLEVEETGKNKPISDWKGEWFEKNHQGNHVLKDRKRQSELKALSQIYEQYMDVMNKEQVYDYDDMILMTLAALKNNKELLYNLQEKYQYILIDEFQDTNQAQMEIIYQLIDQPLNEGSPNILIVGDDDQAIYGFQGADSSNITTFLEKIPKTQLIVLSDNYRSSQSILDSARDVILSGEERLENTIADLNKQLTAHNEPDKTEVIINTYADVGSEYQAVAQSVNQLIDEGVNPSSIAILARNHKHLVALLPFFAQQNIPVTYDKYDDALNLDSIIFLEKLIDFFNLINQQSYEDAQALLPEILAHPSWGLGAETLWELGIRAYKEDIFWYEALKTIPETEPIYDWLTSTALKMRTLSLEQAIDALTNDSPFYEYYFSAKALENNPTSYLLHLNALIAVRSALLEHLVDENNPTIKDFSDFIKLNRAINQSIGINQNVATVKNKSVNLITAHGAKGLEFDHVFIVNANDNIWGTTVRKNSSGFSYPSNLHLAPSGDTLDERIRLFYVAITRAKETLSISHSRLGHTNKQAFRTSFLNDAVWPINEHPATDSLDEQIEQAITSWSSHITTPNSTLKELLASKLANFRLSASAINSFIDLSYGGPQNFLLYNLLNFPSASSANMTYGSAMHKALEKAHLHFNKHSQTQPLEDTVANFEKALEKYRIDKNEQEHYTDRGVKALHAFLASDYAKMNKNQKPEVNFNNQQAVYDNVPLTGKTDVFEIDDTQKTIIVTDYKTGKPSPDWKGKSPYGKIKLHQYKQQLMFYRLLIENSRDYSKYKFKNGYLSFVEPDEHGQIHRLDATFTEDEYKQFKQLVKAVYQRIVNLDLPDVSEYSTDKNGVLQFEQDLISYYDE